MKTILIILMAGYKLGGVGSAEFDTPKACETARERVEAEGGIVYRRIVAFCVPKGEDGGE